jgi:hypothetical protein
MLSDYIAIDDNATQLLNKRITKIVTIELLYIGNRLKTKKYSLLIRF